MKPSNRLQAPILLALVVAVGILFFAHATQPAPSTPDTSDRQTAVVQKVHALAEWANEQEAVAGARVVELPEDGLEWSTVFVWPENRELDPRSRRLASMVASSPRLQSLLAQTKTFHYTTADDLYRHRYASHMGGHVPQFWLMRPDPDNAAKGTTIYKVSGENLPNDGGAMASEIGQMIGHFCPRPRPKPEPEPQPAPVVEPIPDIRPEPEPKPQPSGLPWWVYLLPIIAGGGGAFFEYRRSSGP